MLAEAARKVQDGCQSHTERPKAWEPNLQPSATFSVTVLHHCANKLSISIQSFKCINANKNPFCYVLGLTEMKGQLAVEDQTHPDQWGLHVKCEHPTQEFNKQIPLKNHYNIDNNIGYLFRIIESDISKYSESLYIN